MNASMGARENECEEYDALRPAFYPRRWLAHCEDEPERFSRLHLFKSAVHNEFYLQYEGSELIPCSVIDLRLREVTDKNPYAVLAFYDHFADPETPTPED